MAPVVYRDNYSAIETFCLPTDCAIETFCLPTDSAIETFCLPADSAIETLVKTKIQKTLRAIPHTTINLSIPSIHINS